MATITSVNNTTPGATYNIHDTTTWIGGVVPGPNDTVVFQSATATKWYLTQNWTIQGVTWTASTNRSDSGVEVPNTVSQNITWTNTVSTWIGGTTPMQSAVSESRATPFLLINNPVGTIFTLNLPGGIYYSNTGVGHSNIDTTIVRCTQAGSANINAPGLVMGHQYYAQDSTNYHKNAIAVIGSSGSTTVTCTEVRGGYNPYGTINAGAVFASGISIRGLTGTGTVVINTDLVQGSFANTSRGNSNGCAIYLSGALASGVSVNVTGDIRAYGGQYGNIFTQHTSGTLNLTFAKMITDSASWAAGINENYDTDSGKRYCFYQNGNSQSAVVVFNGDIYGPYNIYNSSTNNNWNLVTSGAATHRVYGNIYSWNLNRYQIPFYFDNESVYWYHMSGTAYNSVNPIVWSTRVQFLTLSGGFYHANVVQSNDPTNLYSPNRCPFIVPTLTPNPNYTGGNQLTWTYIKGWENRGQTTTMINANYTGYSPAESNVRLGTVYGNGLRTGTCAVPLPSQVATGIGVDDTVGTWAGDVNVTDPSSFATAVWNYNLTQVTNTTNGTGQRLLNNATIESTGEQIAALGV
jgi:hypothetical protein